MKRSIVLYAVAAALGGFLFGFDTAVISGAEQAIQKVWALDSLTHGLAVAIALYGTVLGAMFSGKPSDLLGRKKALILIGLLYSVSAIGSALAPEEYSFMFFRFIGGIGVGASSVIAPLYIAEISPAKSRGKLVMLFQLNIVIGIFLAYMSNYALDGIGQYSWRMMLGVEALPALIFTVMTFFIAESPRWLIIIKKDISGAVKVLRKLYPADHELLLSQIQSSANTGKEEGRFFSARYKIPIMLVFIFAFLNQVSGINAIIYYAPRIFSMTGLEVDSSLLSTAGIGFINMLFTIVGMVLIDRTGRRMLMFIGSVGMTITLALVARAFHAGTFEGVEYCFFVYIAFFAMSHGAVIWVFFGEVFPNVVRASGQAFGGLTHWIFAAVITNLFPLMLNKFDPAPVFMFFSVMMAVQLLFVWKLMPETKGVPLEEIERKLGIKEGEKAETTELEEELK